MNINPHTYISSLIPYFFFFNIRPSFQVIKLEIFSKLHQCPRYQICTQACLFMNIHTHRPLSTFLLISQMKP